MDNYGQQARYSINPLLLSKHFEFFFEQLFHLKVNLMAPSESFGLFGFEKEGLSGNLLFPKIPLNHRS